MNLAGKLLPVALLAALLTLLLLNSCTDDPYEVGFDLLPPSDTIAVKTTDTATVLAYSVLQDSVRTDKYAALTMGSINDPVFGNLTSSFYTQLRIAEEVPSFGTNPVLDSLVLMLFYNGYYGDTTTRLHVRVYELAQNLSYDSVYYSNQNLETYSTLLADQYFVPAYSDSVDVGGEKLASHLRINLSNLSKYLGNKLLNAPEDVLQSNLAFTKFMKGLYVQVTPVNSKGVMLNFALSGSNLSQLVTYYHDGNDPEDDSLKFILVVNDGSARFIHTDHNGYLGASQSLKQQVLNRDTTLGKRELFLQGMGGIRIKVDFPFIKQLPQGKVIAINDALLVMQNQEKDTVYGPPPALMLMREDSAGRIGYLIDEGEGSSYFGGIYDASKGTYTFRITQHIQNILQGSYKTNFDLYLMVNNTVRNYVTPNRVVLNGTMPFPGTATSGRMHLKVTYTILH